MFSPSEKHLLVINHSGQPRNALEVKNSKMKILSVTRVPFLSRLNRCSSWTLLLKMLVRLTSLEGSWCWWCFGADFRRAAAGKMRLHPNATTRRPWCRAKGQQWEKINTDEQKLSTCEPQTCRRLAANVTNSHLSFNEKYLVVDLLVHAV